MTDETVSEEQWIVDYKAAVERDRRIMRMSHITAFVILIAMVGGMALAGAVGAAFRLLIIGSLLYFVAWIALGLFLQWRREFQASVNESNKAS